MRWRVGQGNRHLQQAAILNLSSRRPSACCTTSIPTSPFHQHTSTRWPAVALQARRVENIVSDPETVPQPRSQTDDSCRLGSSSVLGRTTAFYQVYAGTTVEETPIPADCAGAIDALCHGWTIDQRALTRMRGMESHAPLLVKLVDRDQVCEVVLQMADTKRPRRALQVLILSWTLGCKHRRNTYDKLAYHFAQNGQWDLVIAVADLQKQQTGRLTVRLLDWHTRALLETENFRGLDRVLETFKQERLVPQRRTYHLLISGYLKNRDLGKARQCLVTMEGAGISMDGATHALIVSMYRSFGADPTVKARALSALSEVDQRTGTRILNSLLQTALDAKDLPGALRVLALFGSERRAAAAAVRPAGHGAFTTQQDGELTESQPSEHTAIALWPLSEDAATFTILLNYLAGEVDPSRSAQVMDELRAKGVQCDGHLAAAIVRTLFAVQQASTAVDIIRFICRHHQVPESLLSKIGLSKGVNPELCRLLADIQPSTVLFNALLQGVLKTQGISGVRNVQRVMKHVDVLIDEHTLQVYLEYVDKTIPLSMREAMSTFRRFIRLGVRPTLGHLHIFLSGALRRERAYLRRAAAAAAGNPDDFIARMSALSARHLATTTSKFDPTGGLSLPPLQAYRAVERALARSLRGRGVRSDRATFALRMRHAAVLRGDLDAAETMFRRMVARGMHPNRFHYAALMEGHALAGNVASTEDVFRRALASGIVPNVVMYTILIMAHARARDPAGATRVFKRMVEAEIKPDATAVLVLVKAFLAKNATRDARRALVELWSVVEPLPAELLHAPLRLLVHIFQSKAKGNRPEEQRLSKSARRILRWKLAAISKSWESALQNSDRP